MKWMLAFALSALSVCDMLLTRAILASGGSEGNLLVRPFVDTAWFFGLKTVGVALIAFAVAWLIRETFTLYVMAAVVAVYMAAVVWNSFQIVRVL